MRRRTFLQTTAAAGTAALLLPGPTRGRTSTTEEQGVDSTWLEDAVNSAIDQGAEYAEILFREDATETLQLRKDRMYQASDGFHSGMTMRVFRNGAWGSASVSEWNPGNPSALAASALRSSRIIGGIRRQELDLSNRVSDGKHEWSTPINRDPFAVSFEEKHDFLLSLTEKATKIQQIPFAVANLFLVRRRSEFINSLGAGVHQTFHYTYPNFAVTAFHQKKRRMDSRSSEREAQAAGWEVTGESFDSALETAMQEVLQLQTAEAVTEQRYDLVVHPTLLWDLLFTTLLPHLDPSRLLGLDGARPGDRWLKPEDLGHKRIGSPLLNLRTNSSLARGLASCGWDDSGRAATDVQLLRDGIPQMIPASDTLPIPGTISTIPFSRSAQWNAPADAAMPNIVMDSGEQSLAGLVSSVDTGLLVKGRGTVVLNPAKTLFRVRPQMAWMIRGGKIAEVVRGVEIETSVEQFWNALDVLGGSNEAVTSGDLFPSRALPIWSVPFSVSAPPALFRDIPIYSAKESS